MGELYHLSDETVEIIEEIQRLESSFGPLTDEVIIHRAVGLYLATSYDLYNQAELRPHDWTLLPIRHDEAEELEERAGDVLDDIFGEPVDVDEALEEM
jgi:hypothetical protein